jgi:hypothetical protein
MKKIVYYFLVLVMTVAGCRPAKKVQIIEEAITKKDTATRVVVTPTAVDSMALVNGVVNKLQNAPKPFTTFYAKVKVGYSFKDGDDQATAFIRIRKDSAIWVSLNQLGIEGYRLLVRPDSVFLMAKINMKWIQARSIKYLQELTELPLNFYDLQNLIVGNALYVSNNIVSYKQSNNEWLILLTDKLFRNLVTINAEGNLVQSKLDDADPARTRTCILSYSDYEVVDGYNFPKTRSISVAEKSKLDVTLEFKQTNFNTALSFPFSVPANYKRK